VNAAAESFFSTLEWELFRLTPLATKQDARREVARFIDWYNRARRHSAYGDDATTRVRGPRQRDDRLNQLNGTLHETEGSSRQSDRQLTRALPGVPDQQTVRCAALVDDRRSCLQREGRRVSPTGR
jgi:Integrase core domain